jgi:transcription antitermination factor NusG
MPILQAEPALYPPDLFANTAAAHPLERHWAVLHVKPRQEKSLARELYNRATPFYLPLTRRFTPIRGRQIMSLVPCFPGYVFVLATADERLAALGTKRVVRPLAVADQDELWHDLRQVSRLLAINADALPNQELVPGTLVEVLTGPLAGLQGVVIRTASGRRLWVQVNFIQQGVSVLLDDCALAPLPSTARRPAHLEESSN